MGHTWSVVGVESAGAGLDNGAGNKLVGKGPVLVVVRLAKGEGKGIGRHRGVLAGHMGDDEKRHQQIGSVPGKRRGGSGKSPEKLRGQRHHVQSWVPPTQSFAATG